MSKSMVEYIFWNNEMSGLLLMALGLGYSHTFIFQLIDRKA